MHAYADTSSIATLPSRATRLWVLVSGLRFEIVSCLILFVLCKVFAPGLPEWCGTLITVAASSSVLSTLAVPFMKNDGYYMLQQLTSTYNRQQKARVQAYSALFGGGHGPGPWWTTWYGVADIAFPAALIFTLGLTAGLVCGWPGTGSALGFTVGCIHFGSTVRGLAAAENADASRA